MTSPHQATWVVEWDDGTIWAYDSVLTPAIADGCAYFRDHRGTSTIIPLKGVRSIERQEL